jgi:hypothetical protein
MTVTASSRTYARLFVEIAFPFLLLFQAARPFAVAMGLLVHLRWPRLPRTKERELSGKGLK